MTHKRMICILWACIFCLCFLMGCQASPAPVMENPASEEVPAGGQGEYMMQIFCDGQLTSSMYYTLTIPTDQLTYVGTITAVTDTPTRELECDCGSVGQAVYRFNNFTNPAYLLELEPDARPNSQWQDPIPEDHLLGLAVGLTSSQVDQFTEKSTLFGLITIN